MDKVTQFLANHHGKIMSVLGTLLTLVGYVASGNPNVQNYLAQYGLMSAAKCTCGCSCSNCHCNGK